MWRGFHKMSAERFEAMASFPSTFETNSPKGVLDLGVNPRNHKQSLFAVVEDDLFEPSFIQNILETALHTGYAPALLNQGDGKQEVGIVNNEVRQSQRCVIDSPAIAGGIWDAMKHLLPHPQDLPGPDFNSTSSSSSIDHTTTTTSVTPTESDGTGAEDKDKGTCKGGKWMWVPVCVNPRLRVLKYTAGDHFEVHQDGSYTYTMPTTTSPPPPPTTTTTTTTTTTILPTEREDEYNGLGVKGEEKEKGKGRDRTLRSFLTLQLYLSNGGGVDHIGGSTRFFIDYDAKKDIEKGKGTIKRKVKGKGNSGSCPCLSGHPLFGQPCFKHGQEQGQEQGQGQEQEDGQGQGQICEVRDVVPRSGRVLLFQHNIWHDGERVVSGMKIVLRSEVMYEYLFVPTSPS